MIKEKNLKRWGFAAVLLFFAAVSLMLFACSDGKRENYEKGVEYYDDGDFASAKQCFLDSDGYGNSADFLANITQYEQMYLDGVSKIDAHDYAGAYAIFEIIPKYENSAEYIEYIDGLAAKFIEGERLYNEKKYIEARNCFIEACSYSSSDEYVANIDAMAELYNKGMELKNAGKYSDAIKAFRGINTDFEDSAAQIAECIMRLEAAPISLADFISNYNAEYPDGSVSVKTGSMDTQFSLADTQGVIITGATDVDGMINLISFSFGDSLVSQLGEEGYNEALAHFIHATNPYTMEFDDLIENLQSYIRDGQNYGCMNFNVRQVNGSSVLEATLSSGE